jgi:hypothetical protein
MPRASTPAGKREQLKDYPTTLRSSRLHNNRFNKSAKPVFHKSRKNSFLNISLKIAVFHVGEIGRISLDD